MRTVPVRPLPALHGHARSMGALFLGVTLAAETAAPPRMIAEEDRDGDAMPWTWPAAWKDEFESRSRHVIEQTAHGFKILTFSSTRGADTIVCAPCPDPLRLGSPMYQERLLAGPSAVAQLEGCAIYLTRESDHPYLWTIPADAALEERDGVTFVHSESCTLALWPINLRILGIDEVLTERVRHRVDDDGDRTPRWPDSSILRGDRITDGLYGFAVEVSGTPDEVARSQFVEAAARLRPETTGLTDGVAAMTPVSGRRIRVQWAERPTDVRIWRDGTLRNWTAPGENVVFGRPPDGTAGSEEPVITLPWRCDGTLTVRADGRTFACTVSREGRVTFRHD